MRRKSLIGLALVLGLLASVAIGDVVAAKGDPVVGTWYSRERHSNSFYFVDDPIGGVYHVLFFDDHTGLPAEPENSACPDNGPFLWTGLGEKTDPNTLNVTFGPWWCPALGGHEIAGPIDGPFDVTLAYNPDSDTINEPFSICKGTRQPHIHSLEKAIHELNKGKFLPTGVDVGCP